MDLAFASKEFKTIVSKATEIESMLETAFKAAKIFSKEMVKADSLLEEISQLPFPEQQPRLDREFNPLMRSAATPTQSIADSSRNAARLLTELNGIFIRTQK